MSKVAKLIKRNILGFTLLGISLLGGGFWGYTFYLENKFNQPIIG